VPGFVGKTGPASPPVKVLPEPQSRAQIERHFGTEYRLSNLHIRRCQICEDLKLINTTFERLR